jgi:thioredoxin 1
MENVRTVTDASFQEDVLQADRPVLVDFWAEWCAPCRMMAGMLEEIARAYSDRLIVAKVNIEENESTADAYGVMSIPLLSVFKDGEVVKRIQGAKAKSAVLRELADYL